MRIKQFMLKKNFIITSMIILLVTSLIGSSCKNDSKPEFDYVAIAKRSEPLPFKLKKGQINWNQTEGKQVSYLNFFTTYNRPKGEVQVDVQAYNASYNLVGKTMRLKKRNNNPVNFPSIGIDQNIIETANLPILDATGKLVAFDSLQLTPDIYTNLITGEKYLRYGIRIYKDGMSLTKEAVYSLPCPPCWNCKPREATCIDIDAKIITPVADTATKPAIAPAKSN